MAEMTEKAVVLHLISLFFCSVSGANLQYKGIVLDSPSNVTLTVGGQTRQRVLCVRSEDKEQGSTLIEWYNPQGQLVSRDGGDEVNQAAVGRFAILNFLSYQYSQGGKYRCRVTGPGNNTKTLSICIGPTVSYTLSTTEPPSMPSTRTTSEPSTTTQSITTLPSPTPPPLPSKVMNVRVTPSVQGTSPTLTVMWQGLASGAVTYTVKYSTQPGEVNTPPEDALEMTRISGTSTILTALKRGTTYYIWVVGVSEEKEGPHSNRMSGLTYDKLPHPAGSRVSVVALNEAGKLRVTWRRPRLEAGQVITGYSVQYKIKGTSKYTNHSVSGSSTTSYTITNLSLGTEYRVRVATIGNLGRSDYCCDGNGKFATTYNYVPQLTDESVSVVALNETGKVRVTWSTPTLVPGEMITGYSVQYRRNGTTSYTKCSVSGSNTTTYTIANLNLSTLYEVRVASVGPLGLSGYCCGSGKQVTTYDPLEPPLLNITSGSSWLYVNWNAQSATFRVLYRESGAPDYQVIVPTTSQLSYNISALQPNTLYNAVVEATHTVTQQKVNSSVTRTYTIPHASSRVSVQVMSADSIKVFWTPAPTTSNISVTYYINASSSTYQTVRRTVTDPDREVVISGLHPFSEYYITVQAGNPGGLSELTGRSATTLTAAPSAPPVMREVKIRAHWAMVGWGIPPEVGRNGIIISYIVQLLDIHGAVVRNETVAVQDPTFDSPQSLAHNLTSLKPYTSYVWRVAATTTAGTGPFSPIDNVALFLTLQWIPVSNLSYEEDTDTSVNITWKPPKEPNGVIKAYFVEHGVYQNESTTSVRLHAGGGPMYTVIRALDPGVPYTVTVSATTTVGEGEPVSIVVFSMQQAPTAQVSNVKVERMNNNRAALVSWTPLTLHQARGFPVYFVTYQPSSVQVGRVTRAINTVNTTDSKVVIDDLDPTTEYSIAVDVGTAGGKLRSTLAAVTATLPATMPATMPATSSAEPSTEEESSAGAVAAAVVIVFVVLLVIGIVIVIVVVIVLRRKTRAMSFKPDVTTEEEEEVKKASPHIPQLQSEQTKEGDSESIEMVPLPTTNQESPSLLSEPVHKSDFSEHVKVMHKERDSGFEREYQTIDSIPDGVMDIAKAHRPKNRYLNIHTYDASRVVLSVPDADGSDYINASYIDGYNQTSAYIASQGPNALTVSDFIQMVWDQRSPVLVMLTRLVEKGKSKCERYWCDEMNKPFQMPDRGFIVTVTGKKVYADYEIRDMTIEYTGDPSSKPLKLKHFFFTAWPDHGVPQHPYSMVKFIQHIRKVLPDSTAPLVVHCSAGVGRTGTFIAVDAMMQRLKEKDDLDIYNFVTQMRSKRTFMVQNMDQYAFIHDALNDYLRCGNTAVVAHELRMVIADMQKEDSQTSVSGFKHQFKLLQELSQVPCMADINYAKKASIMKRNRYKDRFPYSTGHIHLSGKASHHGSKTAVDYYNASFLDGYSVPKAFIAAQSPMSHTKGDFWQLVWQFRTPTIVLLTNFMEGREEACANVWPAKGHETIDHFDIKCSEDQSFDGYDRVKLEITHLSKSRSAPLEVTVFHFKKWPIDGNPEIAPLLGMMGKMDRAHQKKDKAALVMCDDGMSRTGVFIAAMCEVERVKVEGEVDIFQTIKAMRKKRPHMVYNKEQYTLCFELLQAYLDSFDTYANFKAL